MNFMKVMNLYYKNASWLSLQKINDFQSFKKQTFMNFKSYL